MSEDVNDPQQKPRKKMGRPSKYSDEIAAEILRRIAEGESLNKITKEDGMPSHATVYLWLLQKPDFSEKYTRAREEQAETLADEIVEIADEQPELDPLYDKNGELIEIRLHSAYIQWQKNRVDARKWVAAKLKPKKYGDRQVIAGDKDNPLEVKADMGVFEAILQNLELQKQKK